MFLHPLVLARWAEIHGNDCGSDILSQTLKDAGTSSFVPISDPFEDIPSCSRTGLSVARRSHPFAVRKGGKTRNYGMHKLGGWDGQYFSYNVCSLTLGSWKNAQ